MSTRYFHIIKLIGRHTWLFTAATIILLAALLSFVRVLLPQMDRYRQEVELQLSQLLRQPVTIREFDIGWHGLGPRIYVHDVRLLDKSGQKLMLGFDEAHMDINVPLSLFEGELRFIDLVVSGVELRLLRRKDGSMALEGLGDDGKSQVTDTADGNDALDWLMSQGVLQMENSVIIWQDLKAGVNFTFAQVNLRLQEEDGRHRLSGRLKLPSVLGQRMELVVDLDESPLVLEQMKGRIYTRIEGARLGYWRDLLKPRGVSLDKGTLDLRLWAEFERGGIASLKGAVDASDLLLSSIPDGRDGEGRGQAHLDTLYGDFTWQDRPYGWELDVDRLRLRREGDSWPATRMHVDYSNSEEGQVLEVGSTFLRLGDIYDVAVLGEVLKPKVREQVVAFLPQGDLSEIFFRLNLKEGLAPDYFFRSRFENLAINPVGKVPGFNGFDGLLSLTPDGGRVELDSLRAYLDTGTLFRDYLVITRLLGRVDWQLAGDGLHVDLSDMELSNSDLRLLLDGQVYVPASGDSPVVSVLMEIAGGSMVNLWRYLPVKIMSEKTVEWLDRAVVTGDITDGAVVLHGPLDRFPFNDHSGLFEVRFNLMEGILDYAEGWPRLDELEAEMVFRGSGMKISGHRAKLLSSEVSPVTAEIANFRRHPALLEVNGRVTGPMAGVVQYLNESPLNKTFGTILAGAKASGPSVMNLSLSLPLQDGGTVGVKGDLRVSEVGLNLASMGVDLARINGRFDFTHDGFKTRKATAVVMGQPATVDIDTRQRGTDASTLVFDLKGQTRLDALAERVDLFVFDYLRGETDWKAHLSVPQHTGGEAHLELSSGLRGVGLELPSPLAKPKQRETAFRMEADFGEQETLWSFDYGARTLSGVFAVKRDQGNSVLERGELRFGADAELPGSRGVRIAGRVERFSLDEWDPVISNQKEDDDQGAEVKWLDVEVGESLQFEETLHDIRLQAEKQAGIWQAHLTSREMAGLISTTLDVNDLLVMNLDYLLLPGRGDEEAVGEPGLPQALPPVDITSKRFEYGDMKLGGLRLKTSKQAQGLIVEQLETASPEADVQLVGSWNYLNGVHNSVLQGAVKVKDLGGFQQQLGFARSLKKGDGVVNVDLRWLGGLVPVDFSALAGHVDVDIEDGKLLEVDPGAGRLFGLLSVTALPKRFLSGFGDVFGKGFAFDKMRGRFEIRKGSAYTRDFVIDGSAAEVQLFGRVGFVDEDYDQLAIVTPHVTSGLPMWGVLTQSLGTGAALLLVEELFSSKVDKATRMYYTMSGDWNTPNMTRVDENKVDVDRYTNF